MHMSDSRQSIAGLRAARRTLLCALAAGVCAMPACRTHPKPMPSEPPQRASPAVRGAGSGLEVWWWVVSDPRIQRRIEPEVKPRKLPPPGSLVKKSAPPDDLLSRDPKETREEEPPELEGPPRPKYLVYDDKRDLEEVLAPYADREVPLSVETIQRWRASGLRIYAVPQDALSELETRLRLVGPVQRQWLGELPVWTDVAQGPWDEQGMTVEIAGDTVRLGPGRLRMLARAWTAPIQGDEGPRPSLRLELVPQHEPWQSEQEKLMLDAGLGKPDERRGLPIERLSVGASLTTDDALVIVPMDAPEQLNLAPFKDPPRTFGQAMLSRPATETTARARAVLVILPRIAERFDLLGP
jgi:hypothetical protein